MVLAIMLLGGVSSVPGLLCRVGGLILGYNLKGSLLLVHTGAPRPQTYGPCTSFASMRMGGRCGAKPLVILVRRSRSEAHCCRAAFGPPRETAGHNEPANKHAGPCCMAELSVIVFILACWMQALQTYRSCMSTDLYLDSTQ